MIPEPGQTYSLGEDRILVLEVHPTKLAKDDNGNRQPIEGTVKIIHIDEIKELDISSFRVFATRIL